MPTYDYLCETCGRHEERFLTMSARTSTIACTCGAEAAQVISWQGECYQKGAQRDFKLDWTDRPIHWEKGNTDCQAQEDRYTRLINANKAAAKRNAKAATKRGMRLMGQIPMEIVRTRRRQYGKDYFAPGVQSTTELKDKLRGEGLLYE